MAPQLSDVEARVLGALVEKETTTPEYYPLSLNALVNACNQKSNREPVMTLEEEAVRHALRSLSDQAMARSAGGDSRVAKFEHRLNELYNFHRHEIAVLCVLLLRGPQTPGELRTRAERMYAFEDLEAVQSALHHLMRREPPLVKILPRQPGTKESRYMHLLSGDAVPTEHTAKEHTAGAPSSAKISLDDDRVAQLEAEIMELRRELNSLREQFATFQKQSQ
ncbi:MAG TPA: YceH family protein [Candidatus Acidoferrum sp.]|nr:YceH family protein [Candidatus Acidoferrum sp.]